jgi:uroporphyrinogen decarboxylase
MRRDEVIKAITFSEPSRVPIYFFNRDQDQSDIVAIEVQNHFMGPGENISEWGFTWERLDETMGQPKDYVLADWENLPNLVVPDPADPQRFADVPEFNRQYPDRFRMAALGLSGFTTMWCLRGFDKLMLDVAIDPRKVNTLAEIVFGFEEKLIAELPRFDFDAVAFFDDWGTQNGMIVSPKNWRELFKPRYEHQFKLVHDLGMYVYFHCCGQYEPIIPDLIEVGVDVLNISQPNLYDIPEIGRRFGGKVCFICPVSYQTTSISGTREEIFEDVRVLVENLGDFDGGLIGYVEEYQSIGLSEENYQACGEAFKTLGQYPISRKGAG